MKYDQYCALLWKEFISNQKDYNPNYVYKYMDFHGGYLSLKNQTLQFTHPTRFDDKSECRKDRIKFKNQGKRIKEALLSKDLDNTILEAHGYLDDTSNILNKSYKDMEKSAEELWENVIIKDTGVSCFTTLTDSHFHWQNYANNSRGVRIKYDFDDLVQYLNNSELFSYYGKKSLIHSPIIYVDEIMAVKYGTDNAEKIIMNLNWIFVKERSYESECEFCRSRPTYNKKEYYLVCLVAFPISLFHYELQQLLSSSPFETTQFPNLHQELKKVSDSKTSVYYFLNDRAKKYSFEKNSAFFLIFEVKNGISDGFQSKLS